MSLFIQNTSEITMNQMPLCYKMSSYTVGLLVITGVGCFPNPTRIEHFTTANMDSDLKNGQTVKSSILFKLILFYNKIKLIC